MRGSCLSMGARLVPAKRKEPRRAVVDLLWVGWTVCWGMAEPRPRGRRGLIPLVGFRCKGFAAARQGVRLCKPARVVHDE